MMLGKRPRHPIKRTTSMSEITFDLDANGSEVAAPPAAAGLDHRFLAAAAVVSPRNHRKPSADFLETAHFLRACSLCKRRLAPGRDIYMYRGDSAFCSLECRQQQMNQDERKEKCSLASKKEAFASSASATVPEVSNNGETVAAL